MYLLYSKNLHVSRPAQFINHIKFKGQMYSENKSWFLVLFNNGMLINSIFFFFWSYVTVQHNLETMRVQGYYKEIEILEIT